METKPTKQTIGATVMRLKLKMSGLNAASVEPAPPIKMKPKTMMSTPMANKIKFVLSKAKFLLSISYYVDVVRKPFSGRPPAGLFPLQRAPLEYEKRRILAP